MHRTSYFLFGVCLFLSATGATYGTVPPTMNVQGRLTDASGNPVQAGARDFTFRIFDDALAGSQRWPGGDGETQSVETDSDGLWNANLGSIIPLTDDVYADNVCWLEITVDDGINPPEVLPRIRLTTGPFAYRVSTVDGASGGTITSKLAIGSDNSNDGVHAFVAGTLNEASGDKSAVTGGANNHASGEGAFVGGGSVNFASGISSVIGGGNNNIANGEGNVVAGGVANKAIGAAEGGQCSAVLGGTGNTASGRSSSVGGGYWNKSSGWQTFVGGGNSNEAAGWWNVIGGGMQNYVGARYAAILGGYADTIDADAEYSYLFGIKSKLTQDSTFMVDMPHIRFGDEATGYEFPPADGSTGQILSTDGSGQLSWASSPASSGWIDEGPTVRLEDPSNWVSIGVPVPVAPLGVQTVTDGAAGYFIIDHASNEAAAVQGQTNGTGAGVAGVNTRHSTAGYLGNDSTGVYGFSGVGWAGYFVGPMYVGDVGGVHSPPPTNRLDVAGGVVIGNGYAGNDAAPWNGLAVRGRVGIGTPNPAANLHVFDTVSTEIEFESEDEDVILRLEAGTSNVALFSKQHSGGLRLFNSGTNDFEFASGPDGTFTFNVWGNDIVRVNNTGVGIQTLDPKNKLDVEGGVAIGALYSGTNTAPTNGLIVQGNVGIGTSMPNRKLYLAESAAGPSFPLKLDNYHSTLNQDATGILFSVGGEGGGNLAPSRGKGALVYEYTDTWNRGDFHFLQDTDADSSNPKLTDAAMTIKNNGNVGVGTDNPGGKLEVAGYNPWLMLNTTGGGAEAGLRLREDGGNRWSVGWNAGSGYLFFYDWVNPGGTRMVIQDADGYVGIGTATPSERLHVNGNLRVSGNVCAANVACPSDIRLKTDIMPLETPLNTLEKIRGVRFNWRADAIAERGLSDDPQVGFIAGEVEKVFPEVVHEMSDGFKAVDYSRLVPVLVEAIKEQQGQIRELLNENASLTERVVRLEGRR